MIASRCVLARHTANQQTHRDGTELTLLLDTLPQLRAALAPRSRIPGNVPMDNTEKYERINFFAALAKLPDSHLPVRRSVCARRLTAPDKKGLSISP